MHLSFSFLVLLKYLIFQILFFLSVLFTALQTSGKQTNYTQDTGETKKNSNLGLFFFFKSVQLTLVE